jgi:hypothetical protein
MKKRSCLKCRTQFHSRSPGHRICWRCRASDDFGLPAQFAAF